MIDSLFFTERADEEEDVDVFGEPSDLISFNSSTSIETRLIATGVESSTFDWLLLLLVIDVVMFIDVIAS
jgi:hypothetical protein